MEKSKLSYNGLMKLFLKIVCLTIISIFLEQLTQPHFAFATNPTTQIIYNPLPDFELSTTSYGKYLSQTTVIQDYPHILVGVFLQESIFLMNLSQNCTVIALNKQNVISAFSCGSFLYFITDNSTLVIQQFIPFSSKNDSAISHQYLINVNAYSNSQLTFNSLYVDSSQKYVYLGCFGQLVILDVSNKISIQEVAIVGVSHDFSYWVTVIENQYVLLSNYYSNILIFDISDIRNPTFYRTLDLYGKESIQSYYFQQQKYLYSISYFYCLQITNLHLLFENKVLFQSIDETAYQSDTSNLILVNIVNSMKVSSDENYLFLGIRSNGFIVYDISTDAKKLNPVQIMNINSFGFSTNIQTAGLNDRYIVFSEGISLKIYDKALPNTSQAIMNLFNLDQCIFVNAFQSEKWPWDVIYIENQYLVFSGGYTGFAIYDVSIPLVPVNTFTGLRETGVSYDNNYYLSKRKILLIGQSEKGIAYYNTSLSAAQPTFMYSKVYTANPDTDDFMSNNDETILAFVDEKFFGFINITDIYNTYVIDSFELPETESRSLEGISMDENFLYGCAALRSRGVYYFKFEKNKITIITFLQLYGAESLRYDKRLNGIFYVADGISGVTVLNAQDKTKDIQFVNSIPIQGWAGRVFQPDGNLNVLIVNHQDRGTLSVLDITYWSNVTKIQELQFIQFSSFSAVTDPDNTFIAITVPTGFRICQTNTPLTLHTQQSVSNSKPSINVYQRFNSTQSTTTTAPITAQIGASVSFTLVPLFYSKGFQFIQLYLYEEFQQQQIPSWITFLPFQQMINILPQQSSSSTQMKTFYILLVQISLQLYATDFISTSLSVTSDISTNLFNYFINQGILTRDGYLRTNYDSSVRYIIQWNTIYTQNNMPTNDQLTIIYDFTKQVLDESTFFYPVSFNVFSSLFLDITSTSGMVITLSSQADVTITLIFNSTIFMNESIQPQFIRMPYVGVLSDLKNNSQSLELKGIVASVNTILRSQIYIFVPQSLYNLVQIQFLVSDEINVDLTSSYNLTSIQQFNKKKELANKIMIQDQYNEQYPSGLTVETTFTINIDSSTFVTESTLTLTYSSELLEHGKYKNLTSLDWISMDTSGQGIFITGIGDLQDLGNSFTICVNATDGYEEISQTFTIKFTKVPLQIILSYVGYASMFLFFVVLIFCLRQKVHMKLFTSHFIHSLEKVYYKDYYLRKIFFMQNYHIISTHIVDLMKKEFLQNNQPNLQQISSFHRSNSSQNSVVQKTNYDELFFLQQYITADGTPNMTTVMADASKLITHKNNKFKSIIPAEFQHQNTRLFVALQSLFAFRILVTDRKTEEIFSVLKKSLRKRTSKVLDWYQQLLENQYGCEQFLLEKQKEKRQSKDQIHPPQLSSTQSKVKEDKMQSSQDRVSLQTNSQVIGKNNNNQPDAQDGLFILPEVNIREESLIAEIKSLFNLYERQEERLVRQNTAQFSYNINLLKSVIKAECQGFGNDYAPKSYKSSSGSVLHLRSDQVKNICLYQKSDEIGESNKRNLAKNCKNLIQSFFGLNFTKIAQNFQSSTSVRSWLKFEITENYILLQGMPSKLNIGDYMVQIQNSNRYIAFEYSLQVGKLKMDSRMNSIKHKLNKIKETSSNQAINTTLIVNNQTKLLDPQLPYQSSNLHQEDDDAQLIDINKHINDHKFQSKNSFFEIKLQGDKGNNTSSFLTFKNQNKSLKLDEDVESNTSMIELQKRISFDKSSVNIIPQFLESGTQLENFKTITKKY